MSEARVAVVTGGGSGIGEAAARRLARAGYTVAVLDIDGTKAVNVARSITENGGVARDFRVDVTDPAAIKDAAETIDDDLGSAEVLVNSGGVLQNAIRVLDMALYEAERILRINYLGTVACCQAFGRVMKARKRGSIINLASIWGLAGVPSAHAYQAAKGAILNISKNVACAHGEDGIRCNSLHPGYIVTPMNKDQGEVIERALIEGTVLKRAGRPDEIAYAAVFLASDEASYVTGTSLVVDGGYLAP